MEYEDQVEPQHLSTCLYRRINWNEDETQALFGALAAQGKTLEELSEAVGTRTIE